MPRIDIKRQDYDIPKFNLPTDYSSIPDETPHEGRQTSRGTQRQSPTQRTGRSTQVRDDAVSQIDFQEARSYGAGGIAYAILSWLSRNQWLSIVIAILSVLAGMMVSRFITVGISLLLVLFGYLMEQQDVDNDSIVTYASAIVSFVIPFMF